MDLQIKRRATLLSGMFCAVSLLFLTVVLRQGGTLPVDAGEVLASLLPVF